MSRELQKLPWVINTDTGCIFIKNEYTMVRPPLESYHPTLEEIAVGHRLGTGTRALDLDTPAPPVALTEAEVAMIRSGKIAAAIKEIDPSSYGKAAAGRPALPKVGEVRLRSEISDVTVDEILAFFPAEDTE